MKAKQYTVAMLIALIFAAANIQAQSARRPVTQENKERTRTASTYKKESTATRAESTPPARKVEARTSQPARETPVARSGAGNQVHREYAAQKQPVNTNRGKAVANQNANIKKPVSMSTSNNPRSTYRKPNKVSGNETRYSAPVKSDIYYNRGYYSGNHYHYVYPRTSVRINYHHHTYLNHYDVLYYPAYGEIYWNRNMYRDYISWYPGFHWSYNYGHRIQTISVWDAKYNLGEVALVYGRVYATWYNNETDDFLLFFGGDFPYQQFTAVVPGYIARNFSRRPERFFLGEHVTVTGLITTYDGSPEIVIKNGRQLSLY